VALLGGFAALTRVISMPSIAAAVHEKFSGPVADKNVAAAEAAFEFVRGEVEELARA
jgi:pyruvate ferredoxin oxidoreductase gamma subunit